MQISEIISTKPVNGLKAVVISLESKTAKNGKPYLTGELMDQTGTVGFKVWDNTVPLTTILAPGNAVEIKSGIAEEYQGVVSIKIASAAALEPEEAEKLIQVAPVAFDALQKQLDEYLKVIPAEIPERLKKLGLWDRYLNIPAAMRHHHVYRHGLLQHSLEVCELALQMADMMRLYHKFEPDGTVLIISALFHDIGKIDEYDINALGLLSGISEEGELLGHHFPSALHLTKCLAKTSITADQLLKIKHCVLSHHGRRKWGAAVSPKTPEAYIIHLADMGSSQPVSVISEHKPLYDD